MTNAAATLLLVVAVAVGGLAFVAVATLGATVAGGRVRRHLRGQRTSAALRPGR
jgi:hypothetical protein